MVIHDLNWLTDLTKCLPVNDKVNKQAIESQFGDFEDAIQYFCALQNPKCDAIITSDRKGFRLSTIPFLSPNDFLSNEYKA